MSSRRGDIAVNDDGCQEVAEKLDELWVLVLMAPLAFVGCQQPQSGTLYGLDGDGALGDDDTGDDRRGLADRTQGAWQASSCR